MAGKLSLMNESSDESEVELKINKNYATRYDNWRRLEEMQKLKDLSKEVSDSSSDEEIEPTMEKDFFRTLSLIKAKDPRVYDKKYQFFKGESPPKKEPKPKKEKPMLMKEYNRKLILETNGEVSDEEEEQPPPFKTYSQEEQELKNSFKAALQDSDDDDDDEDLFKVREKSKVEVEKEENEYKQWLETDEDMKHLNQVWSDPNLDANEQFLRDYFLKEWYLEKNKDEIPTHEEIVGDATTLSEDERNLEESEKFEHKYNFRFEEPGEEFIQRYPRNTSDSLRRTDTKRKQKREEYAERKKKEKELKREELKRLKALKRREIEERFSKLREVTGKDELNFDPGDMEGDFDPEEHDRKMREMFDENYYTVEETQKPEFEHDEEIDDEQWDTWHREPQSQNEGDNFNDEVDENENEADAVQEDYKEDDDINKEKFSQEMIESTSSRKKRRNKKSLFAKIISQPKPLYDPSGKSFEDYLEEYYKLDYEDIIGDQPVRYRYRKVIPNDFGLSVDEILAAHDKELNQWCSIKKTCQYRKDEEEMRDIHSFKRKGNNMFTKQKILASVYAPKKEEETVEKQNDTKKKRKKKKKNKDGNLSTTERADGAADNEQQETMMEEEPTNEEESKLKSKKKKKHSRTVDEAEMNGTSEKSDSANEVEPSNEELQKDETSESSLHKSKRKRKRRKAKSIDLSESNSFISAEIDNGGFQSDDNEVNRQLTDNRTAIVNPIESLIQSYKNAKVISNSDSKNSRVQEPVDDNLMDTEIFEKSEDMKSTKKRKRKKSEARAGEENLASESISENMSIEPSTVLKKKNKKKKSTEQSISDELIQPNSKKLKQDSDSDDQQSNNDKNTESKTEETGEKPKRKRMRKRLKKKKKKKKKKPDDRLHKPRNFVPRKTPQSDKRLAISDDRLAAFGFNPKRFKHGIIFGNQ